MKRQDESSGVVSSGELAHSQSPEPSLAELLSRLSRDASLLAQQEIALAKQEAADKLSVVKAEVVGLVVGGVLLHAGILAVIAGAILLLALLLPPWVAALVAGGVLLAVGGGLLLSAKARLSKLDLAPKKSVQSVKQDVRAVKEAAE